MWLLFLVAGTLVYLSSTPENGKNGQVGKEEILANNVAMNLRERESERKLTQQKQAQAGDCSGIAPTSRRYQGKDARAFGERGEGVVSVSLWVLFALWNDRV